MVELPAGQFVRAEELSSSLVMYWHPPVEGGVLVCRGAVERRSVRRTKSLLRPYLYAVGGSAGVVGNNLSSVERYDEEKDEWEAVADMSTARSGAGACVLGGRLYAVGGCDDGDHNLSSVERYDEEKDKWEVVADLSTARCGAGAVEEVFSINALKMVILGFLGVDQKQWVRLSAIYRAWFAFLPRKGVPETCHIQA